MEQLVILHHSIYRKFLLIYFYIWKLQEVISVTKKEKLLQLMDEIQNVVVSLKEVVAAMSPEERARLVKKIQEKH